MKLANVLEFEDGMVVPDVSGLVEAVYEEKTGGEGDKAWRKQDLKLVDGNASCYVNIWDPKVALEGFKGKRITLSSKKNKGKLDGLKVEVYNGKKKLVLGRSGGISIEGATEEPSTDAPAPQEGASAPKAGSRVEYDSAARYEPKTAKQLLYQSSQAYLDVVAAANHVRKQALEQFEIAIAPDHFQALCATLFIKLDKSGFVATYPTHAPKKEEAGE